LALQQRIHKFAPLIDHPHMRQEPTKSVHIAGSRPEKVKMGNRTQEVAEYLKTIVDEVGKAELPADRRLFVALTAKEHPTARDACRTEEVAPLEPTDQHRLSRLVAARHQPDAVPKPLLGESCNSFASTRNLRRSGVALSPQVVDLVIFADTVNDDASDVDPERF
jgi:hypothetical protein